MSIERISIEEENALALNTPWYEEKFDENLLDLFWHVCKDCNLQGMKFCIRKGVDVNSDYCPKGVSKFPAFHYACEKGNLTVVHFLVENGIDTKSQLSFGCTGFHLACKSGKLKIVKYLIGIGFDINSLTCGIFISGQTGFHLACNFGHLSVVKYLMEMECDMNIAFIFNGNNAFHSACQNCSSNVVQFLIQQNVDQLNSRNRKSYSALEILLKKLDTFKATNLALNDTLLCFIEAGLGQEIDQNHYSKYLAPIFVNRVTEITFVKQKLFEKFTNYIAQTICDFTMLPSTDMTLQNLWIFWH
jgi:ankyrin repeat protein